ncbi:hypothetical protein JKG47_20915 [Acidithiobacillus sp. MC6.1]|nr:hypothetical protein [Acidithiobacillus sp. MC6.1]
MIGIDTTIDAYGLEFTEGEQVDSFFVCFLFNALEISRRFASAFEMVTQNPSLWMMAANSADAVYDLANEKTLISEFSPNEDFPFHRLYCYRYGQSGAVAKEALASMVSKRVKAASTSELLKRYNDASDAQRSTAWVSELKKALSPSTLVAEGRIQNTTVEKVIVLYRKAAGCVLCGGKAKGFVGSTVGWPTSILYIANTCETHQTVAKQFPTILHFVFDLFQLGLDIGAVNKCEAIPANVLGILGQVIERELCARLTNTAIKGSQTTLTFERDSGFHVILRLKTLMNYGYMLDYPDGTPYRRIDSAPDHPDIPFFPDHLHLAPGQDNSNVVSSYTYGYPLLDLPSIKNLLLAGEAEYAASEGCSQETPLT